MKNYLTIEECEKLTTDEISEIYKNHVSPSLLNLLSTFSFAKDKIVKAEGVWLETDNGKKILDVTGGSGVLNLGHNPKEILEARQRHQQLLRPEVIKSFLNPYLAAASFNLAGLMPAALTHVYFCNSGAEAAEGALKLSYKFFNGKRKYVLHSSTAFHGKLVATSQITGVLERGFKFQGSLNADYFNYNDVNSLEEALERHSKSKDECEVYAVIIEPFSATGIVSISEDFLEKLFELKEKYKFQIIFDEIYTGFFKTGPAFSFMAYKYVPDTVLVSKTLGGGKASISAYVTTADVIKKSYPKTNEALMHSSTYNGFAEECLTAVEALRILHQGHWQKEAERIEATARKQFNKYSSQNTAYLKLVGRGALLSVQLNYQPALYMKAMSAFPKMVFNDDNFLKKLVLLSIIEHLYNEFNIYSLFMNNSNASLMFTPSLIMKDSEIETYFSCLNQTLEIGIDKLVINFVKSKVMDRLTP